MVKDHTVHKYKRIKFKTGYTIYRCMIIGCSHFLRAELAINRQSVCWKCGETCVIKTTDLVKPHCEDCSRNKKKEGFGKEVVDTLMNILGG